MVKHAILQSDFDFNFDLIAIVSSAKDYKLCWDLNKNLLVNFEKKKELEIHFKKKKKMAYFSFYLFEDEINRARFKLLGNKSKGEYLTKDLKEADYLLLIEGKYSKDRLRLFIEKIGKLSSVQMQFKVDPNKLKQKENLIF